MKTARESRISSIELLRILSAFFVTMLHYNYNVAFKEVHEGELNYWILNVLECVSIPAVNIFILITGYFLCLSNKRRICKPLSLVFQVFMYSFIFGVVFEIYAMWIGNDFMINRLATRLLFPNYFVVLYVVLYLVSPYLNVLILGLSKKAYKRMLVYLFFIFSLYAMVIDIGNELLNNTFFDTGSPIGQKGSQFGYTIVHFTFLYLLGAYIRVNSLRISAKKNILGFLSCLTILVIWRVLELLYCKDMNLSTALSYNNPITIGSAFFLFLIFKDLTIKSKLINELSSAAFTCYIIQGFLLFYIGIPRYVNDSFEKLLVHIAFSLLAIYLISYVVYKLYSLTIERLFDRIKAQIEY